MKKSHPCKSDAPCKSDVPCKSDAPFKSVAHAFMTPTHPSNVHPDLTKTLFFSITKKLMKLRIYKWWTLPSISQGFHKWNTKSLNYSEGSWLDYSHSYPSRNRNAWYQRDKAATLQKQVQSIRGLPHSFLYQISLTWYWSTRGDVWNRHLSMVPCAFEFEIASKFQPGFEPGASWF